LAHKVDGRALIRLKNSSQCYLEKDSSRGARVAKQKKGDKARKSGSASSRAGADKRILQFIQRRGKSVKFANQEGHAKKVGRVRFDGVREKEPHLSKGTKWVLLTIPKRAGGCRTGKTIWTTKNHQEFKGTYVECPSEVTERPIPGSLSERICIQE